MIVTPSSSFRAKGTPALAYDDTGGSGPLVVLLPGAGDLRSEHRFLAPALSAGGYRVATADLPGHGESDVAPAYGVAQCGGALLDLLAHLEAGPAAVVACSFAPAAAIWAATERPDAIARLVMISPHITEERSLSGRLLRLALSALFRGPWAAGLWVKQYRSWYPSNPPADLDGELVRLRGMLANPGRRRAVRDTLIAHRRGMDVRIARLSTPSMVVFGSADSHFKDPAAEAKAIADRTGASALVVDGAGHYPHVERPEVVAPAVLAFLAS